MSGKGGVITQNGGGADNASSHGAPSVHQPTPRRSSATGPKNKRKADLSILSFFSKRNSPNSSHSKAVSKSEPEDGLFFPEETTEEAHRHTDQRSMTPESLFGGETDGDDGRTDFIDTSPVPSSQPKRRKFEAHHIPNTNNAELHHLQKGADADQQVAISSIVEDKSQECHPRGPLRGRAGFYEETDSEDEADTAKSRAYLDETEEALEVDSHEGEAPSVPKPVINTALRGRSPVGSIGRGNPASPTTETDMQPRTLDMRPALKREETSVYGMDDFDGFDGIQDFEDEEFAEEGEEFIERRYMQEQRLLEQMATEDANDDASHAQAIPHSSNRGDSVEVCPLCGGSLAGATEAVSVQTLSS